MVPCGQASLAQDDPKIEEVPSMQCEWCGAYFEKGKTWNAPDGRQYGHFCSLKCGTEAHQNGYVGTRVSGCGLLIAAGVALLLAGGVAFAAIV
jgi:hypothetical protein